jgi:type II secretory pathway predicted ATPase ExeA
VITKNKTRVTQLCLSQVIDLSLPTNAIRTPRVRLSAQARRQAQRFQALPKNRQRFVIQMIDLLEKA